MKFAITKNSVIETPVDRLLSDVVRVSVQYGNLTPNEKKEFDAKLENLVNTNTLKLESKKEATTQTANLGGDTEYNEDSENDSAYIKQLKAKPQPKPNIAPEHLLMNKTEIPTPKGTLKKLWLNNLME